jgi:hypothetical protein
MMYVVELYVKYSYRSVMWAGLWCIKLILAPFRLLLFGLSKLLSVIIATPAYLWRGPVKMFRVTVKARDWILGKVAYLEQESQKWKTTFMLVKSPYTILIKMGLNPQMATSLLIGGSAIGGGVVVNETLLTEPSFARGDAGVYAAPIDQPEFYSEQFNTLRVDLGTVAVKTLEIDSVSIGDIFAGSTVPNSTTVIDVGGVGSVDTWLVISHLIFENNRCSTLLLTSIQTNELVVMGNVSDGQSLAMGAGAHIPRNVNMGHHSSVMTTTSGLYDRIQISAPTSGTNGQVGTLRITNAYTRGGGCWLHRIKAGKISILNNTIGEGDGLANKDFEIQNSVTASSITSANNVEFAVSLPATLAADS